MSEKILEDQLGYSQKFIDELRQLQKFLLSVTAKDVSMLITFRTIADPSLGKIDQFTPLYQLLFGLKNNHWAISRMFLDHHQVWRSDDPMSVQTFDFCEKKMSYPLF